MEGAYVYLLECSDSSLYCGITRKDIDERLSEHQNGQFDDSYTSRRRPVVLIWCEYFAQITDAVDCERRIKGWSRQKKLAMIRGDWREVSRLAVAYEKRKLSSPTSTLRQAQGEVGGASSCGEVMAATFRNQP